MYNVNNNIYQIIKKRSKLFFISIVEDTSTTNHLKI